MPRLASILSQWIWLQGTLQGNWGLHRSSGGSTYWRGWQWHSLQRRYHLHTCPKALHIEIDKGKLPSCHHLLENLYSSLVTMFPLDVKMHLVRDHKLLTNTKAKTKEASLRANQQRFLSSNIETCITWELSSLDLQDTTISANLHNWLWISLTLEKLGEKLFNAVNKMLYNDGYIFQFNPSQSQSTREIVTGLLVFLRHVGIYNHTSKISQVCMGPCTTDAWWDAKERCIVTKADAELDDLMNQDVDLTFPEDEVTINLTQVQEVL